MKKILIISTTGMGDTLWGTPAIRAFKKKFPQGSIDLLIQPQLVSLLLFILLKNKGQQIITEGPYLLGGGAGT